VKGLDDTDGETTIVEVVDDDVVEVVVVVDVSAARKGATTVTVATLTNTTTHSKTRILFIPKTDGYTNSPAGAAFIRISPLATSLGKVGLTKRHGDLRIAGSAW
jgi:hypothetical protein